MTIFICIDNDLLCLYRLNQFILYSLSYLYIKLHTVLCTLLSKHQILNKANSQNKLNYLRQSRRLIAGAPQRGCLRAAKAAPTYPISTDHNVHLPFPDLGYTL
jgi:hypothetical protein